MAPGTRATRSREPLDTHASGPPLCSSCRQAGGTRADCLMPQARVWLPYQHFHPVMVTALQTQEPGPGGRRPLESRAGCGGGALSCDLCPQPAGHPPRCPLVRPGLSRVPSGGGLGRLGRARCSACFPHVVGGPEIFGCPSAPRPRARHTSSCWLRGVCG